MQRIPSSQRLPRLSPGPRRKPDMQIRKGWLSPGQSALVTLVIGFALCIVFVYSASLLRALDYPSSGTTLLQVETLEDVGTTTPMLHYNATRVTATLHTHIARRQDTPDDMPVGATLSHKDPPDPRLVLPATTHAAHETLAQQAQRAAAMQHRKRRADELSKVNHIAEGVLKAGRPLFGTTPTTRGTPETNGVAQEDEAGFVSDLKKANMLAQAAATVGVSAGRTLATAGRRAGALTAHAERMQAEQSDGTGDSTGGATAITAKAAVLRGRHLPSAATHGIKMLRGFEAVGRVVEADATAAAALRSDGLLTTTAGSVQAGSVQGGSVQHGGSGASLGQTARRMLR